MAQATTALDKQLGELATPRRDRSSTLFTDYQPGIEGTQIIHERVFALAPYGGKHRYFLPFDGDEYPREELANALWWTFGEPLLPPRQCIPQGIFLDLGTGFGFWAFDAAFLFPDHRVIGLDLHYTHDPEPLVNCSFEVDDYELPFTTREESVALVHLRDSFLSVRNFDKLAQEIFGVLCDGGWLQNQEMRLQNWICNKPKFNDWLQHTLKSARNLGIQLHSTQDVKLGLHRAGFYGYAEHKLHWQASRTTTEGQQLRDIVRWTVMGSVGILELGGSGLDVTVPDLVDNVLKELEEEDCEVIVEAHTCVAWKGLETIQPQATVFGFNVWERDGEQISGRTTVKGDQNWTRGTGQNRPKNSILVPIEPFQRLHSITGVCQEGTSA